jgi:molecular chaperone DnaK
MAYYLGIDLGTTYTAAAAERDGVVEALTLGNRTASVPSVLFLRDDGEILVGEAATRRATSDPGRVAREFKRRVGDPTPIILGGTPYAAEMLMARLLRWSVDKVREQQGEPPRAIALTHPANWGPYKLDLFTQAVRQVDLDAALLLAEPVAAATFYASQRRLEPGSVVAVYDLGGGTFDAAMVRRTAEAFEIIGTPEGVERLGGIDFDEAVFAHVREAVGDRLERLDPEEPAAQAAVARLRQECIDAKEALSSDTDVSIPVLLPGLQTEVRLTRAEFEAMIRPAISETIVALRRAIRSASVANDDISAVLLVGGSSRIPLVAQMVGAELGRPIAIDAHPKDAIAFGAAIAVAHRRGEATPESVTTVLPDTRPPPPTMAPDVRRAARPAPPGARPAPPGARPAPPGGPAVTGAPGSARPVAPAAAAGAAGPAATAAGTRPAPPGAGATRPAPPGGTPPGGSRPAPPGQASGPTPARPAPPTARQALNGAGGSGSAPRAAAPTAQPAPMPFGGAPRAGAPPVGGHSSGGYAAVPGRVTGGADYRPLWIVLGVIGAIALMVIIVVSLSGGDESGGGSEGGGSGGGGSGEQEGFTAEVEQAFVERCMAGWDEQTCECGYDRITETMTFEEFRDLDAAIEAGEDVDLSELEGIMTQCASTAAAES